MAHLSLDLSDDLAQLAVNFDQFSHGGLTMDSETVLGIVKTLRGLSKMARQLENEISRRRWNEAALYDEARRTGSNVTLFPAAGKHRRSGKKQTPAGAS